MSRGKKQANGTGERPTRNTERNRWEGRVSVGIGPDGKRIRKRVSGRTAAEVRKKQEALLAQAATGSAILSPTTTVAVYAGQWIDGPLKVMDITDKTRNGYEYNLKRYVLPYVGKIALAKLTPVHVEKMLAALERKGLGANTQRLARQALVKMLGTAHRDGHVVRNVAQLAEGPRSVQSSKGRALTVEEQGQLLTAVAGTRWEHLIIVHQSTGLRPGELIGLRFEDVDLNRRTLAVRGQIRDGRRVEELKTRKSRRTVPLTDEAINAFRAQRTQQKREQLKAGSRWNEAGDGLVFRAEDGRPLRRDVYTQRLTKIVKGTEIGHFSPHDLRHTYATTLLERGMPLHFVAEVLGDSPDTVSRTYSHFLRPKHEVATKMDEVFAEIRTAIAAASPA